MLKITHRILNWRTNKFSTQKKCQFFSILKLVRYFFSKILIFYECSVFSPGCIPINDYDRHWWKLTLKIRKRTNSKIITKNRKYDERYRLCLSRVGTPNPNEHSTYIRPNGHETHQILPC